MSTFRDLLRRRSPARGDRRWLAVAYDQLHQGLGELGRAPPEELGLVLVESFDKASRRPYHQRKLALLLANQRHFALEQAVRGVAIDFVHTDGGYADAFGAAARRHGPLAMMRPAERELRVELAPLVDRGLLDFVPHEGWLSTAADFAAAGPPGGPWRMDAFYRAVRRRTGVLMEGGKPRGGRFSFDGENRRPWRGEPPEPPWPTFASDPVKDEVCELVRSRYGGHPGELHPSTLPVTAADAERVWAWALASCLPHFGPYEDAMSVRAPRLFHTRTAELVNLHRLLPRRLVDDVARAGLPIASQEGFVRQVLGWREFVRHVHEATDGFRDRPLERPAGRPLPPVFWGGAPSGLSCLDHVIDDVWRDGYSHHITRLMVLGNLATLLDVDPRALSDWFWVAYADAYDWVVEPNVLGMATFAAGERMTTKPYVSGAAYLDRMGDACRGCRFDPKETCPITPMYWAWLGRHRDRLAGNQRMSLPLAAEAQRDLGRRDADAARFEEVSAALTGGRAV